MGCVPAKIAPTLTPPPTSAVMSDCFQSATVFAWLDEDGDGVQDTGEMPLAGIEFVLEVTAYSRTTSGEDGMAHIFATSPGGCGNEPLQIVAVKFDGYTLTTAQEIDYVPTGGVYIFGFQRKMPASSLIKTPL